MSLRKLLVQFATKCKKQLGRCWYYEFAYNVAMNGSDFDSLPIKIRKLLKEFNFTFMGVGASRIALGWRNVVIKMEYENSEEWKNENSREVRTHKTILKKHKDLYYLVCPLLKSYKILNKSFLIYPKASTNTCVPFKYSTYDILADVFADMHGHNIGVFCGCLVAIDLNVGINSWDLNEYKEKLHTFKSKNKKFWNKYLKLRQKSLISYKKYL